MNNDNEKQGTGQKIQNPVTGQPEEVKVNRPVNPSTTEVKETKPQEGNSFQQDKR